MPSVSTIMKGLFVLAPLVAAAPARMDARQEAKSSAAAMPAASGAPAAPAGKGGLSDIDILNL